MVSRVGGSRSRKTGFRVGGSRCSREKGYIQRRRYREYRASPESRSHASILSLESKEHVKSSRLLTDGRRGHSCGQQSPVTRWLAVPTAFPVRTRQGRGHLNLVYFSRLTWTTADLHQVTSLLSSTASILGFLLKLGAHIEWDGKRTICLNKSIQ
jgi:hypothetical protein